MRITPDDNNDLVVPVTRLRFGVRGFVRVELGDVGRTVRIYTGEAGDVIQALIIRVFATGTTAGNLTSDMFGSWQDIPPVPAGKTLPPASRTGVLAVTEDDDSLSSGGTVSNTGALSVTEDDDVLDASGSVTPPTVHNVSLNVTEADDTLNASNSPRTGLMRDLVSFYHLADGNDVEARNNLTSTGTPTFGSASLGSTPIAGGEVTTNTGYVYNAAPDGMEFTGSFAISLWALATSLSDYSTVVGKISNLAFVNAIEWVLYYSTDTSAWKFLVSDGTSTASVVSVETPVTGQWYQIVVQYDVASQKPSITVNGGTKQVALTTVANAPRGILFTVGSDTSHYNLNGSISELGVWQRLLTDDEVTYLQGATYPFTA